MLELWFSPLYTVTIKLFEFSTIKEVGQGFRREVWEITRETWEYLFIRFMYEGRDNSVDY